MLPARHSTRALNSSSPSGNPGRLAVTLKWEARTWSAVTK